MRVGKKDVFSISIGKKEGQIVRKLSESSKIKISTIFQNAIEEYIQNHGLSEGRFGRVRNFLSRKK